MLGTAKIVMSFTAMTGILMQTGADGGCVNLGLFPGLAGLATPGIGIATGLNPTPSNFNDLLNPPDNDFFPDDPFGDTGDIGDIDNLNLLGTSLVLRNPPNVIGGRRGSSPLHASSPIPPAYGAPARRRSTESASA